MKFDICPELTSTLDLLQALEKQNQGDLNELKRQDIDLNETPQQKTRKKRHRPKVIIENGSVRKAKQMTPMSSTEISPTNRENESVRNAKQTTPRSTMGGFETPPTKRNYTRRKRTDTIATHSTEIGEHTDSANKKVRKSVKRSLCFDSEAIHEGGIQPTISVPQHIVCSPFSINKTLENNGQYSIVHANSMNTGLACVQYKVDPPPCEGRQIISNSSSQRSLQQRSIPKGLSSVTQFAGNVQQSSHVSSASVETKAAVYNELLELVTSKLKYLHVSDDILAVSDQEQLQNAIVPYSGHDMIVPYDPLHGTLVKRKPRAKVELDSETNRVWLLLMGKEGVLGSEGTDTDKEKWWEEERRVFQGRVESFIARMHLVQGDRRFSQWKGSVVDSVVGVFLTQNVSDHLSSSAFMAMAARFPPHTREFDFNIDIENEKKFIMADADIKKDQEKILNHPVTTQHPEFFSQMQCGDEHSSSQLTSLTTCTIHESSPQRGSLHYFSMDQKSGEGVNSDFNGQLENFNWDFSGPYPSFMEILEMAERGNFEGLHRVALYGFSNLNNGYAYEDERTIQLSCETDDPVGVPNFSHLTPHPTSVLFGNQNCESMRDNHTVLSVGLGATSTDDVRTSLAMTDSLEQCTGKVVNQELDKDVSRTRKGRVEKDKKAVDWDSLRRAYTKNILKTERSPDRKDSVDWESVRQADVKEISSTIRERGMNNMLAERIKDFLDRLVRDHGSIDLEWLRDIPPDQTKDYLLSIRGLGLKSVECVRLLTLHHLAFPVDTNVGRICVRLGWVPLQPLPESLQLHLLELYPLLETIQKYLWPRLCKLDQKTLYELHYQMITFGKVFCTKSKPNCNACPMRGECKHFASAFASARLPLPGPEEKSLVPTENPLACEAISKPTIVPLPILQLDSITTCPVINNYEPIIEEPATPEPECIESLETEIEDAFYEDPDEIPVITLNIEQLTVNSKNIVQENVELQEGDMSKALVALTPEAASIPQLKLKNISRLRTEHQVYELPDSHGLLEGLEQREPDDPCPYLLAIWTPGETAQSMEPPDAACNLREYGKLCYRETCFACNSLREAHTQKVRGTLLIPCRTAMRGSFPLNGTYFQVNEVFADHSSSVSPLEVPRECIWNLPRRTVYFGTSVPTIFRGLTTEGIRHCFWRGFVCVRGFDRKTRAPRPLMARLHLPASKSVQNRRTSGKEDI